MVESSSHPNNMAQTILDRDSPLYCCPNKESRHGRLALCALYQPATPGATPSPDHAHPGVAALCVYTRSLRKGFPTCFYNKFSSRVCPQVCIHDIFQKHATKRQKFHRAVSFSSSTGLFVERLIYDVSSMYQDIHCLKESPLRVDCFGIEFINGIRTWIQFFDSFVTIVRAFSLRDLSTARGLISLAGELACAAYARIATSMN